MMIMFDNIDEGKLLAVAADDDDDNDLFTV